MCSFGETTSSLTCYSTVYAPYTFIKENKVVGIDIDLINSISKKIGISVSFEIIPWSRLLQNVRKGNIDCAMAFLLDSEYTKNMVYMKQPITIGEYSVFIKKENKSYFKELKDFEGKSIAVNRGFKTPEVFQQAVNDNKITQYDVGNEEQSLQMLMSSRVNGVLTDKNVGLFNLQQMKIDSVIPLDASLATTPVFLVFSKKWQTNGIVNKFDEALAEMKQDGTYQKILIQYLTLPRE